MTVNFRTLCSDPPFIRVMLHSRIVLSMNFPLFNINIAEVVGNLSNPIFSSLYPNYN